MGVSLEVMHLKTLLLVLPRNNARAHLDSEAAGGILVDARCPGAAAPPLTGPGAVRARGARRAGGAKGWTPGTNDGVARFGRTKSWEAAKAGGAGWPIARLGAEGSTGLRPPFAAIRGAWNSEKKTSRPQGVTGLESPSFTNSQSFLKLMSI